MPTPHLWDTLHLDYLDEDLVFVRFPDGSKGDVGWHGTVAAGEFVVTRYASSYDHLLNVVRTRDVYDVVDTLMTR